MKQTVFCLPRFWGLINKDVKTKIEKNERNFLDNCLSSKFQQKKVSRKVKFTIIANMQHVRKQQNDVCAWRNKSPKFPFSPS